MIKKIIILVSLVVGVYAGGRLYYAVTGGFTVSNISSELAFNPKWKLAPLLAEEKKVVRAALSQKYKYLGRGCQAYVFASEDGQHVLKFFKYQRFRPQSWINLFTFIPSVQQFQEEKIVEKKNKLEMVFTSWKIAYEVLKDETGVVYVHLNKGDEWDQRLTLIDKMGFEHSVDLDEMEFMLQKRAEMLCPAIDVLVNEGKSEDANLLIDRLLTMLLMEYSRGYADNDHALMQNTGVFNGHPIHIDIGQFIHNDSVKAPKVFKQELFDKTYHFHQWLKKHYPSHAEHLESRLVAVIGPDYFYSAPYVHKGDVAKIPHIE